MSTVDVIYANDDAHIANLVQFSFQIYSSIQNLEPNKDKIPKALGLKSFRNLPNPIQIYWNLKIIAEKVSKINADDY